MKYFTYENVNTDIVYYDIEGMKNVNPTPLGPVGGQAAAAAAGAGGPTAGGSGEGAGQYTRPASITNQTVGKISNYYF